jgi:diaminopimelate epimerase
MGAYDNQSMHIAFTKMQGAGNDFVVLDETQGLFNLTPAQYRFLANRHLGVGADQILSVRAAPHSGVDFGYVIHNADGGQVQHCGNGARCFVRFVRERGLTTKDRIRVKVAHGVIELTQLADGRVTVDMGPPEFAHTAIPFERCGLQQQPVGDWHIWLVQPMPNTPIPQAVAAQAATDFVAPMLSVLSMGNPHAVLRVDDVAHAPVATLGPQIQALPAFPAGVNVGFMQVISRTRIALRVYERGAGETLACGTGACAAVVAGIRLGWLDAQVNSTVDPPVDVQAKGGLLSIGWSGDLLGSVLMTGPATTVFNGSIDIPEDL